MTHDPSDKQASVERQPHFLRRFAKLWGFALFVIVVAIFFRHVLFPFVLACMLAYLLAPVVNRMASWQVRGRSFPRGLAVVVCYLVLLGVLALFLGMFLPKLSGDFAAIGRETPRLYERLSTDWTPRLARFIEARFPSLAKDSAPVMAPDPNPPGTAVTITERPGGGYAVIMPARGLELEQASDGRLVVRPRADNPKRGLEEVFRDFLARSVSGLEGQIDDLLLFGQALFLGVVGVIMKLVLVLMVAAFILIDIDRIHRFARGLIPRRYRIDYDVVVHGIDRGLNGVIRGQLLICFVNGVLTYIGLLIFKVKYSLLLAAMAAVMSLIPIFGSILSTIPIVAIAFISGAGTGGGGIDLLRGVFILAWILGVHFVEANFLNPHILGQAARMHPVLVIFALIAGEHSYGLPGALLAVPCASIIQTLFIFFRKKTWKSDATISSPHVPVISSKGP